MCLSECHWKGFFLRFPQWFVLLTWKGRDRGHTSIGSWPGKTPRRGLRQIWSLNRVCFSLQSVSSVKWETELLCFFFFICKRLCVITESVFVVAMFVLFQNLLWRTGNNHESHRIAGLPAQNRYRDLQNLMYNFCIFSRNVSCSMWLGG